jgi:hypothetical protein
MKKNCKEIYDELVALALGEKGGQARDHLAECQSCRKLLAELTDVVEALKARFADAPAALIEHVKAIRIGERKTTLARLVSTSLSLAGARAEEADSFQAVYEYADGQARLMYVRQNRGWEVLGQAANLVSWQTGGKEQTARADGRFSFKASNLDKTGVRLRLADKDVEIPPVGKELSGDFGGAC